MHWKHRLIRINLLKEGKDDDEQNWKIIVQILATKIIQVSFTTKLIYFNNSFTAKTKVILKITYTPQKIGPQIFYKL